MATWEEGVPTFDAESKTAYNPNSLFLGEGDDPMRDLMRIWVNKNFDKKFFHSLKLPWRLIKFIRIVGGRIGYRKPNIMGLSPKPPPMLVDMSTGMWIKKAQLPC